MRAWVSWSSGKDSAFALEVARRSPAYDVVGLLTSMNRTADRVSMHAVRRDLVDAQAERVGLPLYTVDLPSPCSNEEYESLMGDAIGRAVADGVEGVVFGDLFLDDVRAYREHMLDATPVGAAFPLWGRSTDALARQMIDAGVRAVITCVDPARLAPEFAGRAFDADLLADLPDGCDPCGENGEFHTFVWDAPGFAAPIPIETGDVVERDGFVFCDVRPADAESP